MDGLPDNLRALLDLVPAYVLVGFRVSGLMLFSPLFGSARIPNRIKLMLALMIAVGMLQGPMPRVVIPETILGMAVAVGIELLFGLAIGLIAGLVFVAAQWAGEVIGQQLGFSMSEMFDPNFSSGGSVIGELYFLLTMAIFLIVGGHREMILGIHQSLAILPPPISQFDPHLLSTVVDTLSAILVIALRLAAPVFVTMLIVDLAMGAIGKTMPQLNVMTAGISIRAMVGLLVLALGASVAAGVLQNAIAQSLGIYRTIVGTP